MPSSAPVSPDDRLVSTGVPGVAAVAGGLEVGVVEARLDLVAHLCREGTPTVDVAGHRVAEVVARVAVEVPLTTAVARVAEQQRHVLVREQHDEPVLAGAVRRVRVQPVLGRTTGTRHVVVEPAELELVPRTERHRAVADAFLAPPGSPGLAHQAPEADAVLGAAGVARRVVEVGQPQVVRELVREDTEPAVLGLDGVVVDPHAGRVVGDLDVRPGRVGHAALADVDATDLRTADRTGAEGLDLRVPAVAPDGVGAVDRVAVGLVAARVHDLEVVDVAVRLVEVAVLVEVVAVLVVERLQVAPDLGHRLTGRQLLLHPVRKTVADEEPGVVADDVAAEVAAVARLVERHLHPLGDVTADGVAAHRLVLVELAHPVEVHVVEVRVAVVRLPLRGVVVGPVRLGDLVVQRAVDPQSHPSRRPGRRSAPCSRTRR